MDKNPQSDLQLAQSSSGFSGEAGFSLTEMVMAIAIMSIVGIGAYVVMTSTITSQAKLEKTIEKGFAQYSYKQQSIPLRPPILAFSNRAAWFRLPSKLAYNENGVLIGEKPNRAVFISIASEDAAWDTPKWVACVSPDPSVKVECSPFTNGQSSVTFSIVNPAQIPEFAIARVRAEWPSLPQNHPHKYSSELTITTPYLADCDVPAIEGANLPKFLTHNGMYNKVTTAPPDSGCVDVVVITTCLNGKLVKTEKKRGCT